MQRKVGGIENKGKDTHADTVSDDTVANARNKVIEIDSLLMEALSAALTILQVLQAGTTERSTLAEAGRCRQHFRLIFLRTVLRAGLVLGVHMLDERRIVD